MSENKILAFENKFIRRTWHNGEWWFSVVDIVSALTDSKDAGAYWRKLKQRLIEEGSQVVTFCHGLKLEATDGKAYKTDCATAQGIFRIIQSIPSPKAEPFKQWLAKVGHERVQEMADPALSLDRARELWKKHGRSEKWIQQRMTGQETRNKLTDYWKNHEITEAEEFALLTNLIHQEWADVSVQEHKKIKGIKNQNLRDHMSEAELIFTALAELSTRQIAESENATGLEENKKASKVGGKIAKSARLELESKTGKKVVTSENYLPPARTKQIETKKKKKKS
ncbi:MAG: Bro-N domain-containing protein [Proteobacteria bacterium]|nr:Bro-N domain-containing protein [Pseudomonadota bacterium]